MPKSRNNRLQKKLRPVLHIYCEGAKTEPNYLQGYLNKYFPTNRRLKVIKIEDTKKNTPKQLVDEAIKKKKQTDKDHLNDSFWLVYDREAESKYSDQLHQEAYNKAEKHNICIALSNVCFEVWLLLHFLQTTRPYSCYDELEREGILQREFNKKGIDGYHKNSNIFHHLTDQEIQNARDRSQHINQQTEQSAAFSRCRPYQLNPYTDIYKLLDAVDEFAQEFINDGN